MAWNEPGGNRNDNDPWGTGGGRRGNDQGPPDLDEALKKGLDKLNKMLGGMRQPHAVPYASLLPEGSELDLDTYTSSLVSRAVQAKELGFRAAKLEVCIKGSYSHNAIQVDDDREIAKMVMACREAVGPEMTLAVDVAYCWPDWKAALRAIEMFADADIFFIETPLPSDDIEGYAKLCSASPMRVATGEWLNTRFECLEAMDRGGVDVIQPDVGRVGGLTEARRVADHARDRGVVVVPHCWKSAIGIAASLHLAIVAGNCPFIECLPKELADSRLRRDLTVEDFELIDGVIPAPTVPGLGVSLSDDAVEQFRVA